MVAGSKRMLGWAAESMFVMVWAGGGGGRFRKVSGGLMGVIGGGKVCAHNGVRGKRGWSHVSKSTLAR